MAGPQDLSWNSPEFWAQGRTRESLKIGTLRGRLQESLGKTGQGTETKESSVERNA